VQLPRATDIGAVDESTCRKATGIRASAVQRSWSRSVALRRPLVLSILGSCGLENVELCGSGVVLTSVSPAGWSRS
jgi:hypothetical protein